MSRLGPSRYNGIVALDIETTGLNKKLDKVTCICITFSKNHTLAKKTLHIKEQFSTDRIAFVNTTENGSYGYIGVKGVIKCIETLKHLIYVDGFILYTFNGSSFDLPFLRELCPESLRSDLNTIVIRHVDVMLAFAMEHGYYTSMESLTSALKEYCRKTLSGKKAITYWQTQQREYQDKVIKYCEQDTFVLYSIVYQCLHKGIITRTNTHGHSRQWSLFPCSLSKRTVAYCSRLPMPDQAWMTDPPRLSKLWDVWDVPEKVITETDATSSP